jgi:hypothetical protein
MLYVAAGPDTLTVVIAEIDNVVQLRLTAAMILQVTLCDGTLLAHSAEAIALDTWVRVSFGRMAQDSDQPVLQVDGVAGVVDSVASQDAAGMYLTLGCRDFVAPYYIGFSAAALTTHEALPEDWEIIPIPIEAELSGLAIIASKATPNYWKDGATSENPLPANPDSVYNLRIETMTPSSGVIEIEAVPDSTITWE